MKPACKDCRFWETSDGKLTVGQCHRFPAEPIYAPPTIDTHEILFWMQPEMSSVAWCGEFQSKDPPPDPGFAPLEFGQMPEDMRRHIEKQKLLYGLKK